MSRKATISITGLYKYDKHLFDKFNYPTSWSADDQITFTYALMMECAELEVIYTDAPFMKQALGIWSAKQKPIWDKLDSTTKYEYNPIWNKDGVITETRKISGSHSTNQNGSHSTDQTGSETNTHESSNATTSTGELSRTADRNGNSSTTQSFSENTANQSTSADNSVHSVWGFNGSGEAPADKTVTDGSQSGSGSTTNSTQGSGSDSDHSTEVEHSNGTGSEKFNESSKGSSTGNEKGTHEEKETGTHEESETYERIEQGNIGITTTQQMINEEREVVKFNLMDYIINEFKNRFCILVY